MRTFTFFVRDDRYRVPTMAIVMVGSMKRAAALARERLEESAHHLNVEICEDDEPLARFGRLVEET